VPFYGRAPPLDDVPNIKAPLMVQSAETDPRINASWPDYEAAARLAWQRTVDVLNKHLR